MNALNDKFPILFDCYFKSTRPNIRGGTIADDIQITPKIRWSEYMAMTSVKNSNHSNQINFFPQKQTNISHQLNL